MPPPPPTPDGPTVAAYSLHDPETPAPRSLRTYSGRGVPPALDVARLIAEDARTLLAFHPRSTRSDRFAGYLRRGADGRLYPIGRVEVAEVLADLLERIAAEVVLFATIPGDRWPIVHGLRAYRDALARLSSQATTSLLATLAERVRVPAEVVEADALAWLLEQPRERVRRSEVVARYAAAGSPGGLSRNDFLAAIREHLGAEIETASRGEDFLSLNRLPDTPEGAPPHDRAA